MKSSVILYQNRFYREVPMEQLTRDELLLLIQNKMNNEEKTSLFKTTIKDVPAPKIEQAKATGKKPLTDKQRMVYKMYQQEGAALTAGKLAERLKCTVASACHYRREIHAKGWWKSSFGPINIGSLGGGAVGRKWSKMPAKYTSKRGRPFGSKNKKTLERESTSSLISENLRPFYVTFQERWRNHFFKPDNRLHPDGYVTVMARDFDHAKLKARANGLDRAWASVVAQDAFFKNNYPMGNIFTIQ